jgi:hypothetical protein
VGRNTDGTSATRNNGDDKYPSGVVSVDGFATNHGLAVEWKQPTPLTGDFWQKVWVNLLDADLDEIHQGPGEPSTDIVFGATIPILNDQPPVPNRNHEWHQHCSPVAVR